MIDHDLRVALCHSITARAHLAGAEAAELEALPLPPGLKTYLARRERARAACRRYWREVAACQLLMGHRWEKAEPLGREGQ